MGILDSIVEWLATQIMNLLDMVNGSVLGALGCDMSVFLRYFPAAETLYDVFVAIAIGFILLNLVWQLFKVYGSGIGLSAEDPIKLAIRSVLFIFLAYKQYAQPTVERTPYEDSSGKIKYDEKIVSQMPQIPKRKDHV